MAETLIEVANDFWNIRGSFRIGGLVDIKTQSSLVRLASGNFVFLDACALGREARERVQEIIGSGGTIEAILNLHPFHTVHVEKMHQLYPQAKLYGTQRHLERFPELPWEPERTEDAVLHELFADDFDFSVPRGVDFISANENIHFASVLALHRSSRTAHVDDTLMYLQLPKTLGMLGLKDALTFHPTLVGALEREAAAAAEFRAWAEELIEQWQGVENLCAAHTAALLAIDNRGASIADRLQQALRKVGPLLWLHERRFS
jgi:hypothetical protein